MLPVNYDAILNDKFFYMYENVTYNENFTYHDMLHN